MYPVSQLALTVGLAILITACSSGGGDSPGTPTPRASIPLTGLVATGGSFVDSTVTVVDSTGATVGVATSRVGQDGTYSVALVPESVAPLVVVARRTDSLGNVETLVGVTAGIPLEGGLANVTPVTTLIAALLSRSGDPARLPEELATGSVTLSAARIAEKTAQVQALLDPLLEATDTRQIDPVTGRFTLNGTGYDRLLDSLKITITPAGSVSANIEVGLKLRLADGANAPVAQFTNQTNLSTIGPLPSPGTQDLVAAGTSEKISDLLERANQCYALPLSQRVSPSGSTASDVIAPQCRGLFFRDDPATFKSAGYVIARDTQGAGPLARTFSDLFTDAGTGTVFNQGAYAYTRENGDIMVSYKYRTMDGNDRYAWTLSRLDSDGRLKFIGNQYDHHGVVFAYHQLRRFIKTTPGSVDYYSSGYNVTINNKLGGSGIGGSIYRKVVVTSPFGDQFSYVPRVGQTALVLELKPGTPNIRLRNAYVDLSNTEDPCLLDVAMLCLDPGTFTDARVAQLPANSAWKFEYFLAGNAGSQPDATQYHVTSARALTIPELRAQGLADVTAAQYSALQAASAASGGSLKIGGSTGVTIDYAVPNGALAPYQVYLGGGALGTGFDDAVNVPSYVRSATVPCSANGDLDTHCTSEGRYVASALLSSLLLLAVDPEGRIFASYYGFYLR